ncbi:MAG: DUF402 domain-containing protein [Actinomycetota bacterium]|nr:DUF402 domain-containing protein [Actinomycetota bacterium]
MAAGLTRLVFTKWGNRAHWEFEVRRLGEDDHGVWVGGLAGVPMSRPGLSVIWECDCVILLPHGRPFVASFNAPTSGRVGRDHAVYVDITSPPQWQGNEVTMVDLDLDVVRRRNGEVAVLDEDEFRDHQRAYRYPPHITGLAEQSCAAVLGAVRGGVEPFGRVGERWLARLQGQGNVTG